MNRWYDSNNKLHNYLESLKDVEPALCEKVVKDLMELVRLYDPALLDRFSAEYPLALKKQRWYDQNPYCWILFNGLKHASPEVLACVIDYFERVL